MKTITAPKSLTRSINMTPRGGQDGWKVTGTDWDGEFIKNFGHDLAAAQQFIKDFINGKSAA
jgi:hypothetical protein